MTKKSLSSTLLERMRKRLSNYLIRHRNDSEQNQSQTAEKLGMSVQFYRRLESGRDQTRIESSLGFVKKFSDLKKIRPEEFVFYMFNGDLKTARDARSLAPWETELIELMRHVDKDIRNSWLRAMKTYPQKNIDFLIRSQSIMAKCSNEECIDAAAVLLQNTAKE